MDPFKFNFLLHFSIIGNENVGKFFEIDKRSGQINIRPDAELDVNHLKSDFISFSVEVSIWM